MDENIIKATENLTLESPEDSSIDIKSLTLLFNRLTTQGPESDILKNILLEKGIVEKLSNFLQENGDCPDERVLLCAQIMAELLRTETGRKKCSNLEIITTTLKGLSSDDMEIVYHSARALGNLCFDNDVARNCVYDNNGMEKLIELSKNILDNVELQKKLATVIFGCILNLADTCEKLQKQAIDIGLLEIVLHYLEKYVCNEDTATMHCLLILGCLAETVQGRERLVAEDSLTFFQNRIRTSVNDEIIAAIIDLFGNVCVDDPFKLKLAEGGFCHTLVEIIKKRLESQAGLESAVNICKLAADLVTIILTGDQSMYYLYQAGNGSVFHDCLLWLNCKDEELQTIGVLAAGNFARCEKNCIQMVQAKVEEQLLTLLRAHSSESGNINMQHAVLSALRNLAIPAPNKETLIKAGTVSLLMKMKNIETFPVVYKLLGTSRMVVEKQEAAAYQFGVDKDFIMRVVHWSGIDDHPGVKGESTRLLAWIVDSSKSLEVYQNVLSCGALPPLISMLRSEHQVMQSEGLSALDHLAANCLGEIEKQVELDIMTNSLVCNLQNSPDFADVILNLMGKLMESDKLYAAFKSPELIAEVEKIKSGSSEIKNSKVIDAILALKE